MITVLQRKKTKSVVVVQYDGTYNPSVEARQERKDQVVSASMTVKWVLIGIEKREAERQ